MIYLRLAGKLGGILNQLAYAEKLSAQYNQEIRLYVNGSKDNNKEYYENILEPSGIFSNYVFTEEYPIEETVLFENTETFEQEVAERGNSGQDIIIDGDFFWHKNAIDYADLKAKFSPSQTLLDFMSNYGISGNTLYIDAEPFMKRSKDEFALAGILLAKQLEHFNNKSFDKVFVRSSYADFFKTAGFEEITGTNNIVYIDPADIPEIYREATEVMFPYLCTSSVISNYITSWYGHVLNKQQGHEVGILFPYGPIIRVSNAPDGISDELLNTAVNDMYVLARQELDKKGAGEPSAYDGIEFEDPVDEAKSHGFGF